PSALPSARNVRRATRWERPWFQAKAPARPTTTTGVISAPNNLRRRVRPTASGCGLVENLARTGEIVPQGLKPATVFVAFAARLKSCPFKTMNFPAACEIMPDTKREFFNKFAKV